MHHVVIDIETLAKSPRASILSIGAVAVGPALDGWSMTNTFYVVVDSAQSTPGSYDIEADTVRWWAQQSDAARAVFTDPEAMFLGSALDSLASWLTLEPGPKKIWAKPPRFDIAILEHAFAIEGRPIPWGHRDVLDMRTLIHLRDPEGALAPPDDDGHHNALGDAMWQARYLATLLEV
jgi:hypothetical protein